MSYNHADAEPILIKRFNKLMQEIADMADKLYLMPTQKNYRRMLELKISIIEVGIILADNVTTSHKVRNQVAEEVRRCQSDLIIYQNHLDTCIPFEQVDDLVRDIMAEERPQEEEVEALQKRDPAGCFDQIARDAQLMALGKVMALSEKGQPEFARRATQSMARFREEFIKPVPSQARVAGIFYILAGMPIGALWWWLFYA